MELLQIEGVDGIAALVNHEDGYQEELSWQKD